MTQTASRKPCKAELFDHVFAPAEQALLSALGEKRRAETAAANFAAKEAFLKAVGTGLGGFVLCDLAVLRRESGAPYFCADRPRRRMGCRAGA